jgi:hypothetical protein
LKDLKSLAPYEENLNCRQILEACPNIKVDFNGSAFVPRMAGNVMLKTFDKELLVSELLRIKGALGTVPYIIFTGDSNQMFRQNILFTLLQVPDVRPQQFNE